MSGIDGGSKVRFVGDTERHGLVVGIATDRCGVTVFAVRWRDGRMTDGWTARDLIPGWTANQERNWG